MEKLVNWLAEFNTGADEDFELEKSTLDRLLHQYETHLIKTHQEVINPQDRTNYPLRPSSLGKPALLIAYQYYHYVNKKPPLPNRNRRITDIGNYFERWLAAQILGLGYYVDFEGCFDYYTGELDWWGNIIHCHADLIVDSQLIIECKEVNDYYYKRWFKYNQMSDDRGYLTQASLYCHTYEMPVMLIMGNRLTGEINWYCLTPEMVSKYVTRAQTIVDVLVNKTNSWEECFKYMAPEPPNSTKKGLTVPYMISEIKHLVYELDDNGFVVDYKYPPGYEEYKPDL